MKITQADASFRSWVRRGLIALLAAAAVVLWQPWRAVPSVQPEPEPAPADISNERPKRETAYERDTAALQALLESGAADAATQELAAQKLASLIAEHQNELGLEKALQEAGYANAVVIVQNGAVTVMIPEEKLNETASTQILTLCVAHCGVGAENVRIMGKT